MCPVHEAAQIIPLVHAAKAQPVTQPDWHAICDLDVVRDQQGLPTLQLHDKSLVPGTVVIVGQQPSDKSTVLYPTPGIAPAIILVDRLITPR
jgi:hypothetical protein